jgi:SNF2 family DNA or RNA helicase
LVGRGADFFQHTHHNLSVIMSFETARKDIDLLDSLAWTLVLVDEVHRLKNPESKLTTAFGQFRCKMRIGLTGTAIQNGYEEFWTLLDWTNPGSVGTPGEWKGVSDCLTSLCLR